MEICLGEGFAHNDDDIVFSRQNRKGMMTAISYEAMPSRDDTNHAVILGLLPSKGQFQAIEEMARRQHHPLFVRLTQWLYLNFSDSKSAARSVPSSNLSNLLCDIGVLVRHPHSHCVWTEPDSPFVRRGFHCGVPLRVALEGDTTGRFLLHVTSSIANRTGGNDRALDGNGGDDDGNDDGIDDGRECPQRKEVSAHTLV